MPIISVFLGIIVRLYHADHNPPHVHIQYGEYRALVEIQSGDIIRGKLPRRVVKLVREWLTTRRREVKKAWQEAQGHKAPRRVKPLEE